MDCYFCSTLAPQWIWVVPRLFPNCSMEQKEQLEHSALFPALPLRRKGSAPLEQKEHRNTLPPCVSVATAQGMGGAA
jgi:hypothetical protein